MGRFDSDGVTYETRGSQQGAQIANAFNKLSDYRRRKKLENYKPKIQFQRQNLTYYHLKPFDMHTHLQKRFAFPNYAYYIGAFTIGCVACSYISRMIYDQDIRYFYLINYPKQMKTFDSNIEAISSKFWQIGRDYFGDYIIPSIRTEQEFYNFTYAIKNKIFKIEERKAQSQQEFQVLKTKAIQSDQEIEKFDDAVNEQDKETKKIIWKLEEEQQKMQSTQNNNINNNQKK